MAKVIESLNVSWDLAIALVARHLHEKKKARVWICIEPEPDFDLKYTLQIDWGGELFGSPVKVDDLSRFHEIPRGDCVGAVTAIPKRYQDLAANLINQLIEKNLHQYLDLLVDQNLDK